MIFLFRFPYRNIKLLTVQQAADALFFFGFHLLLYREDCFQGLVHCGAVGFTHPPCKLN